MATNKSMPKAIGLGAKALDDEGRSILYEGCSLGQLSTLFEVNNRDVARRIRNVMPSGTRMGFSIWRIKDAAPYLVPASKDDVEETIRQMSPKDLPAALTKEYWAGQHARLKFEEDNGDLWRTSEILEKLGETFKTLRMGVLLFQDHVERQDELTLRQREIIQTLTDGLLNDLADSLTERFKHGAEERGSDGQDPVDSSQADDDL